jgi:hypothetical protein
MRPSEATVFFSKFQSLQKCTKWPGDDLAVPATAARRVLSILDFLIYFLYRPFRMLPENIQFCCSWRIQRMYEAADGQSNPLRSDHIATSPFSGEARASKGFDPNLHFFFFREEEQVELALERNYSVRQLVRLLSAARNALRCSCSE